LQANIISKELHEERSYREPERDIFESPVFSTISKRGDIPGFLVNLDIKKGILKINLYIKWFFKRKGMF
jgi:hypothetical protein